MATVLNSDTEAGWTTADLSQSATLKGTPAVCTIGIANTTASPITSVQFNGVNFTQARKVDAGSNALAELWKLDNPANGSATWAIDETTAGDEYYCDLMDWKGGSFIAFQHAAGTATSSSGATESLTGTSTDSQVYCLVYRDGANGDAGLTIDGTVITHPSESPNQRGYILSEKPGNGGTVSFTWSASFGRNTAVILFEVKVSTAGNQVIRWWFRRWQEFMRDLKRGVLPTDELRSRYGELMTI